MRAIPILTTAALGAALLAMAPDAAAQRQPPAQERGSAGTGYGFDPAPATPLTPHGQGGAGLIPPVERQYDAARRAGEPPSGGSTALLHAAERALDSGDAGLANEQLERAATALLNQPGIEAGRAGVRSIGPGYHINEARAALARNDIPAARRSIAEARAAIRRADGETATGMDVLIGPDSQGGGMGSR